MDGDDGDLFGNTIAMPKKYLKSFFPRRKETDQIDASKIDADLISLGSTSHRLDHKTMHCCSDQAHSTCHSRDKPEYDFLLATE